jgi:hypothetical protein
MPNKNKPSPLSRLGVLTTRKNFLTTQYRSRERNPLLVTMAISRGDAVWVDGVLRKPSNDELGKIMTLASIHRVVTQEEKSANDEWVKIKPVLEKTERPRAEYQGFMTQRSEAMGRLASLHAQIAAAEADVEAATSNCERLEKELEKILDAAGVD